MSEDDLLRAATLAFRTELEQRPAPSATRARVLLQFQKNKRAHSSRRFAVILAAAALLIGSSAWANPSARRWIAATWSSLAPTRAVVRVGASGHAGSDAPIAAPSASIDVAVAAPPTLATAPSPSAPKAPPSHARAIAESASAPDPSEAQYRVAHRAQFVDHDSAAALDAWRTYLASAPTGRFAPEAHYNAALCLARLGKTADARVELQPFANGAYGDYRRREATELLDALARRTLTGPLE